LLVKVLEIDKLLAESGGGFGLLRVDDLDALLEFAEALAEGVEELVEVLLVLGEELGAFFLEDAVGEVFEFGAEVGLEINEAGGFLGEAALEVLAFGRGRGEAGGEGFGLRRSAVRSWRTFSSSVLSWPARASWEAMAMCAAAPRRVAKRKAAKAPMSRPTMPRESSWVG